MTYACSIMIGRTGKYMNIRKQHYYYKIKTLGQKESKHTSRT